MGGYAGNELADRARVPAASSPSVEETRQAMQRNARGNLSAMAIERVAGDLLTSPEWIAEREAGRDKELRDKHRKELLAAVRDRELLADILGLGSAPERGKGYCVGCGDPPPISHAGRSSTNHGRTSCASCARRKAGG